MRWIVIGFIAYWVLSLSYAFTRALWLHDGAAAIAGAILLTWACVALYGSI
jgi:hypothetical protein